MQVVRVMCGEPLFDKRAVFRIRQINIFGDLVSFVLCKGSKALSRNLSNNFDRDIKGRKAYTVLSDEMKNLTVQAEIV